MPKETPEERKQRLIEELKKTVLELEELNMSSYSQSNPGHMMSVRYLQKRKDKLLQELDLKN